MTDQYHSDLFILWQDGHARGQQTAFEEIEETIQGKLCRLLNSNLQALLSLFTAFLMIKHS